MTAEYNASKVFRPFLTKQTFSVDLALLSPVGFGKSVRYLGASFAARGGGAARHPETPDLALHEHSGVTVLDPGPSKR
jgi:hypothetical protein